MLAWDYELAAGLYDPRADAWAPLPDLPLVFGECYPHTAVLADGRAFAWFCGQAALFDPAAGKWARVQTPTTIAQGPSQIAGDPVAAGDVVYLLDAALGRRDNALWRYSPPPRSDG